MRYLYLQVYNMNKEEINKTVCSFVIDFMDKHGTLISSVGYKYLIPNRYSIDDIKQYISERMMQILTNRLSVAGNQIEDPEKYFKSCLDYYCIEYQRMHGFAFDLPKRPRKNCQEEETEIKAMGFKYLDDITTEESNQLQETYESEQDLIDSEPPKNEVWNFLIQCLTKDEAQVIDCVFSRNMTWNETSKHLGVPQSTCWFRKNRALEKLYEACLNLTGANIETNLRDILRGNVERLLELRDNI